MGYHMAGFDVVGVDIEPQPNYPFKFYKRNALSLDPRTIRRKFDAVAASPPCLGYTTLAARYPHIKHEKLIPATRDLLRATGLPYIIENVQNARLEMISPVKLCGSSFGLRVRRHRLFELSFDLGRVPACAHAWQDRHRPYEIYMTSARGGSRWSGAMPVHGEGLQLRARDDWCECGYGYRLDDSPRA